MSGTTWLSYEDWAKDTNNGQTPSAVLGREFDDKTTLASDLPIRLASGKLEDIGIFEEPWIKYKNSYPSDANGPYIPSTTGTYTRSDILGGRKSAVEIPQGPFELMTKAQQEDYLLSKVKKRFVDISLDAEFDMIYANPIGNPSDVENQTNDVRNCLGLAPRFNKITNNKGIYTDAAGKVRMSPYITLDAGGTGNNLTSVWLIVPDSKNGVTRLMPSDTQYVGGIKYTPDPTWHLTDGVDEVTGKKGKVYYRFDRFQYVYGIAIINRRSCIRIANINFQDDASIKKFITCYRFALAAIDKSLKGARHLTYINSEANVYLQNYFDNRVIPSSYSSAMPNIGPKGEQRLGTWELRECDQILTTEEKLA